MTKGHQGQTCADAIRASLVPGELVSSSELYERVRRKGSWKNETVWQHMIGLIVNLPVARFHWPSAKPFLFLHGDGRYELYDPQRHPATIQ